jgi:hypothetical protein
MLLGLGLGNGEAEGFEVVRIGLEILKRTKQSEQVSKENAAFACVLFRDCRRVVLYRKKRASF